MAEFNWEVDPIADFIAFELIAEGEAKLLEMWRRATFELDDWGDQYDRKIILRVLLPQDVYREIRKDKQNIQDKLLDLGKDAFDGFEEEYLGAVRLVCIVQADSSWRTGIEWPVRIIEKETDKIWKAGYLRLFISHKSDQKVWLGQVKEALLAYGIDSFLAHQEIRATKKWRDMIQQGLQSCHSILTVCTDGFRKSAWCNQEIGWGLARGILVFPLLAGEEPFGFHAEHQGPTVGDVDPDAVAWTIAMALGEDDRTCALLFSGIATKIREASTWESLRDMGYILQKLDNCPSGALEEIEIAFKSNPKNDEQFNTPHNFTNWIGKQRKKLGISPPPSEDEYDPFADE